MRHLEEHFGMPVEVPDDDSVQDCALCSDATPLDDLTLCQCGCEQEVCDDCKAYCAVCGDTFAIRCLDSDGLCCKCKEN